MTRVYNVPIEVECSESPTREQLPRRLRWRAGWRTICAVHECSLVQSDWWRQEVSRRSYTVECEDCELYDIYCQGDRWYLERVWD